MTLRARVEILGPRLPHRVMNRVSVDPYAPNLNSAFPRRGLSPDDFDALGRGGPGT